MGKKLKEIKQTYHYSVMLNGRELSFSTATPIKLYNKGDLSNGKNTSGNHR
jgi:hypothetical protein